MGAWTRSKGTIRSSDLALLHKIKDGYETTGLFRSVIPVPDNYEALTGKDRLRWNLDNWNAVRDVRGKPNTGLHFTAPGELSFDIVSQWNPPDLFFDRLVSLGCDVRAETETDIYDLMDTARYENGRWFDFKSDSDFSPVDEDNIEAVEQPDKSG